MFFWLALECSIWMSYDNGCAIVLNCLSAVQIWVTVLTGFTYSTASHRSLRITQVLPLFSDCPQILWGTQALGTALLPKADEMLEGMKSLNPASSLCYWLSSGLPLKTRLAQSHGHVTTALCNCSILKLSLETWQTDFCISKVTIFTVDVCELAKTKSKVVLILTLQGPQTTRTFPRENQGLATFCAIYHKDTRDLCPAVLEPGVWWRGTKCLPQSI